MQSDEAISLAGAVQCGQGALDLTPEGDRLVAGRLSDLGLFLSKQFEAEGELDDILKSSQYPQ